MQIIIILHLYTIIGFQYNNYIIVKGGEQKVGFDMNEKEMLDKLIDKYADLQRIQKANGDTNNPELNYQLTVTKAKLESFGIITSDLEMK